MQGIERGYCNVCIGALVTAWRSLMEVPAAEALEQTRYGHKADTMGLDAIPEIIIGDRIRQHDRHSILVTEELEETDIRRWPTDSDRVRQPLMFFSDPTDRSIQLGQFIREVSKDRPLAKVGILMGRDKGVRAWEEQFEKPASITGATTSITCVRKGEIIFAVMVNYVTQQIIVACSEGVFIMKLPRFTDPVLDSINLAFITSHGRSLIFPPVGTVCTTADDCRRFVTYLGKTGYPENFRDSMIFMEEPGNFLHHTEPGGPARILYLSNLQLGHGPIGFVMANGEKIGEWIHWLAFAKFSPKRLRVFEISIDRPYIKAGVLMSTAPAYSIFRDEDGITYLDVSRLRNFTMPSKFRSMLVVTQFDNERIVHIMRQHDYREITLTR